MNTPTRPPRNPWPIAIIAFFVVFGIFIASFIGWAVSQKQELVSENYYEQEVRYQDQLDRVNRTRFLAGQTAVTFEPAAKSVVINLPVAQAAGATGQIHFYRPSNAKLDHALPLAVNAEGAQRIDGRSLAAGLWKVRVEWSAKGQDFYFDQQVIVN